MRINIEIDDGLMAEAMAASGSSTKRETVEAGLRLLSRRTRQASARDLFGQVQWEGDLDQSRRDGADGRVTGAVLVDSSVWIEHLRGRRTSG